MHLLPIRFIFAGGPVSAPALQFYSLNLFFLFPLECLFPRAGKGTKRARPADVWNCGYSEHYNSSFVPRQCARPVPLESNCFIFCNWRAGGLHRCALSHRVEPNVKSGFFQALRRAHKIWKNHFLPEAHIKRHFWVLFLPVERYPEGGGKINLWNKTIGRGPELARQPI